MNDRPKPDFSRAARVFAREVMKNKTPEPTGMEMFGWMVIHVILVIAAGVIFAISWNWIITDIFPDLPSLLPAQGVGIRLITLWCSGNVNMTQSQMKPDQYADYTMAALFNMFFFLFVAFIAKQAI